MAEQDLSTPRLCRSCGNTKPLLDFPITRGKRYHRCRVCHIAKVTEWHRTHAERVSEIKNKYRAANWEEEKRKAREKSSLPEVRAKKRASLNRWRTANPDKDRSYQAKRRKQLTSRGPVFTDLDVKSLYQAQRALCASPWCKKKLSLGYHVDHIMPLCRGGANDASNIQLLCPSCNVKKNSKDPIEWAQMNGRLF